MKDLISLSDITSNSLNDIFDIVDNQEFQSLRNLYLCTAFFQSSTRTRLSFEVAMQHLGGSTLGFSDMKNSRCQDNYFEESLDDFVRVLAEIANFLVIRHSKDKIIPRLSKITDISLINAGDGKNEHPTQALQDIWLMRNKSEVLNGKTIGFLGDISRNFRSMIYGLQHFKSNKLLFMLPPRKKLPEDIELFLSKQKMKYEMYNDLNALLSDCDFINTFTPSMDVLESDKKLSKNDVLENYIINYQRYQKSGSRALILNAGPRTYEVSKNMDGHPNFLFFEQVRVGIEMRKGILSYLALAQKNLLKTNKENQKQKNEMLNYEI